MLFYGANLNGQKGLEVQISPDAVRLE